MQILHPAVLVNKQKYNAVQFSAFVHEQLIEADLSYQYVIQTFEYLLA
jgi:hypothetical protein